MPYETWVVPRAARSRAAGRRGRWPGRCVTPSPACARHWGASWTGTPSCRPRRPAWPTSTGTSRIAPADHGAGVGRAGRRHLGQRRRPGDRGRHASLSPAGQPAGGGSCGESSGRLVRRLVQRVARAARAVGNRRGSPSPGSVDPGQAGHLVLAAQVHQPHALRRAAHPRDPIGGRADDRAVLRDQHHLIAVADDHRAGQPPARLGVADGQHAHRPAALGRVLLDPGALAEAVVGHHQQVLVVARDLDRDHLVARAQLHARDAAGIAAHRPRVSLGEAHGRAVARHHQHVVVASRSAARRSARRPRGS